MNEYKLKYTQRKTHISFGAQFILLSFCSSCRLSKNLREILSNFKCCKLTLLPSHAIKDLYFTGSQRFINSENNHVS